MEKGVGNRTLPKGALPNGLRWGLIAVLAAGVFFRFYHLDRKVYWIDETNSSLRTLGYTKTEMMAAVFTGQVIDVADLQHFQTLSPERDLGDTFNALKGTAEHTPLYFLLARLWIGLVGHSVAAMRGVAAFFSVLVLPCLYWFCQELFAADDAEDSGTAASIAARTGWMAMALVAVTPVHVLYGQEARPYSLWTALILLSSTLLLRAMRFNTRRSWLWYGLSLIAGLYTQLLFVLIAFSHAVYVLVSVLVNEKQGSEKQDSEKQGNEKWRSVLRNSGLRNYGLTTLAGFSALVPWLVLLIKNWQKVQESTTSLNDGPMFSTMVNRWFLNLNLAFLDRELGAANLVLVLISLLALYCFSRLAPRRAMWFILLLIGVPFLTLAIPDILWGGRRALRIRYLFPCFLGIQIALAYVFATQAVWVKTWRQQAWRLVMMGLIAIGLGASITNAQTVIWWNKSFPRSSYYPPVAEIINRADQPLVVSDGPVTDTLSFSAWLKPEVKMQLSQEPRKLKIAPGYDPVYILNATESFQKILARRGYELTLIYQDQSKLTDLEERLWIAQKTAK